MSLLITISPCPLLHQSQIMCLETCLCLRVLEPVQLAGRSCMGDSDMAQTKSPLGWDSQRTGKLQGCHAVMLATCDYPDCVQHRAQAQGIGPGLEEGLTSSLILPYISWERGPFSKGSTLKGQFISLQGLYFLNLTKEFSLLAFALQVSSPLPSSLFYQSTCKLQPCSFLQCSGYLPHSLYHQEAQAWICFFNVDFSLLPPLPMSHEYAQWSLGSNFFSLKKNRHKLCGLKVEVSRWCYNYSTKVWRNASDMESIKIQKAGFPKQFYGTDLNGLDFFPLLFRFILKFILLFSLF